MGFLHPAGRGRAFPGRLGGQLFTGGFPPGGLPSGLLGSGHFLSPAGRTAIKPWPPGALHPYARQQMAAGAAAASSPSPNDSGCAERRRRLPREGQRGEEPLPAPRAAGNTASGPVSHHREADRTEGAGERAGRKPTVKANFPGSLTAPAGRPGAEARGPQPPSLRSPPALTQSRGRRPLLGPPRRC